MKIALCSTFSPFIKGGYRNIVEWLQVFLEKQGHHVEKIYLPEIDRVETLAQQMMAFRWIDLEKADRIICFRPQSHLIPHPHKILWFIHHIRFFYDLWDKSDRLLNNNVKYLAFRDFLFEIDNQGLKEAQSIFTNSKVVSNRLKQYNNMDSEVLYPPLLEPEKYQCLGFNDEIVYLSRVESHKRQQLLIEALSYTKTPVRLRLLGESYSEEYPSILRNCIHKLGLSSRVIFNNCWITEQEKINQLAYCLAVAYFPLDEDSYGYPSLEASYASKPILTTTDSGGVLELVENGINGYVVESNPMALAEAMDRFYLDKKKTKIMGQNAYERLSILNISWDHIVEKLLL